jgi:putative Holliday junction resolvase
MPRILGLDYGQKRLGFAVSDPGGEIAMPLCVVEVTSADQAATETARVCAESEAERLVVGLPVNMDGTRSKMMDEVEAFVQRLAKLSAIPVDRWDERLSTKIAERFLVDTDMSRAKRRRVRDKLAAQVMLQGYLDAQQFKHAEVPA